MPWISRTAISRDRVTCDHFFRASGSFDLEEMFQEGELDSN